MTKTEELQHASDIAVAKLKAVDDLNTWSLTSHPIAAINQAFIELNKQAKINVLLNNYCISLENRILSLENRLVEQERK